MQWIAISGSWRKTNAEVERDVRAAVADIIKSGKGIIVGGALGVDFIATQEALKHNPTADRIKVIIPSSLEVFAAHYRRRADEGVITLGQAESLIALLTDVRQRRSRSFVEMAHKVLNETTYYDRNTKVLETADELLVFQVNNSAGTQDTIDKARKRGLPVTLKQYIIEQ